MAGRHRAAVVGVGSAMEHRPTLQRAMRHEAIRESVEAQRQLSESIQRAETRQLKVAPTIHAIYEWSDASAASHFGAHEVAFYMWLEHAIEAKLQRLVEAALRARKQAELDDEFARAGARVGPSGYCYRVVFDAWRGFVQASRRGTSAAHLFHDGKTDFLASDTFAATWIFRRDGSRR